MTRVSTVLGCGTQSLPSSASLTRVRFLHGFAAGHPPPHIHICIYIYIYIYKACHIQLDTLVYSYIELILPRSIPYVRISYMLSNACTVSVTSDDFQGRVAAHAACIVTCPRNTWAPPLYDMCIHISRSCSHCVDQLLAMTTTESFHIYIYIYMLYISHIAH